VSALAARHGLFSCINDVRADDMGTDDTVRT